MKPYLPLFLLLLLVSCHKTSSSKTSMIERTELSELFTIRNPENIVLECLPCPGCTTCETIPGITYHLEAKNIPRDQSFSLFNAEGISIDTFREENGLLISQNTGRLLNQLPLTTPSLKSGFIATYYLRSSDKTTFLKAAFNHNAIAVQAQDGAVLEIACLDNKEAQLFGVIARGFKPYEKLLYHLQSCNETIQKPLEVRSDGTLLFTLAPAVKGHRGGLVTLRLLRETETLALSFPWGSHAHLHPSPY